MIWLLLLPCVFGADDQVQFELKPCDEFTDVIGNRSENITPADCRQLCVNIKEECCGFAFAFNEPNVCYTFKDCKQFLNHTGYTRPLYVKIVTNETTRKQTTPETSAPIIQIETTEATTVSTTELETSTETTVSTRELETSTETTVSTTELETSTETTVSTTELETSTETTVSTTELETSTETTVSTTIQPTTTLSPPTYNCSDEGKQPVAVQNDELYSSGACSNVTDRLPNHSSKFKKMPTPNAQWYIDHVNVYKEASLVNSTMDLNELYEENEGVVQVMRASSLAATECALLFICKNNCQHMTINGINDTGHYGWLLTWGSTGWSVDRDRRSLMVPNSITKYSTFTCPPP